VDLDWGGKLVFYNCIVGGVIDARFIPSILKGVMEKMEEGPITGSYVRDVRVLVHDGKMHPVDSNDISFKIAGMMAFKDAFMKAEPQLLEPDKCEGWAWYELDALPEPLFIVTARMIESYRAGGVACQLHAIERQ